MREPNLMVSLMKKRLWELYGHEENFMRRLLNNKIDDEI